MTITIYKEDIHNPLHPNIWESMLEDLGVATHTEVAGRMIDNEITEVTLTVSNAKAI